MHGCDGVARQSFIGAQQLDVHAAARDGDLTGLQLVAARAPHRFEHTDNVRSNAACPSVALNCERVGCQDGCTPLDLAHLWMHNDCIQLIELQNEITATNV